VKVVSKNNPIKNCLEKIMGKSCAYQKDVKNYHLIIIQQKVYEHARTSFLVDNFLVYFIQNCIQKFIGSYKVM